MTAGEFNIKYKDYLEKGHYGCDIHIPEVINYLDTLFDELLTNIPGFKYFQIKEKFHMARFYTNLNEIIRVPLGHEMEQTVERKIDEIFKSLK